MKLLPCPDCYCDVRFTAEYYPGAHNAWCCKVGCCRKSFRYSMKNLEDISTAMELVEKDWNHYCVSNSRSISELEELLFHALVAAKNGDPDYHVLAESALNLYRAIEASLVERPKV